MKKILFSFMAVLAIVLSGCKVDNATVTVSVKDTAGSPVADRYVFYTDKASAIFDEVLPPSPTDLIGLSAGSWQYVRTNAQGLVTFKIPMAVAKAKFYFIVFDEGSNQWNDKEIELRRGENEEISFEVNR